MAEIYNQEQETTLVNKSLVPLPQPHLTGMKLQGDISLGDFLFNTIDEYGVIWVITDIKGWWQHPEPDMPDIPRGFGDGSYDIKGRYQARMLTLEGAFLVPDPSLVESARDRLIQATNLVYNGAYLRTGTTNKRASFVRLSGAPEIETVNAKGRTDFSIGLKAADPIKYLWNDAEPDGYEIVEIPALNPAIPFSGSLAITNTGNVAVPLQFELAGPITAPATIYNRTTNKLLTIVSPLRGRLTSSVENIQMIFDEYTLSDVLQITTRTPHGLIELDEVEISGMPSQFSYLNGSWVIDYVLTNTTFEIYISNPPFSKITGVTGKKLLNGTATLTTNDSHGLIVGNEVVVADVDLVFNGTYVVTAATDKTFSYAKARGVLKDVTGAILTSNTATLTTFTEHELLVGDIVTVSGVGIGYDGEDLRVTAVDTFGFEFSYTSTRTNRRNVVQRRMFKDLVTLTMAENHGFIPNENAAISGMEEVFNGTYKILTTSINQFTYEISRATSRVITTRSSSSNIATLTLAEAHNILPGELVEVYNVGNGYSGENIRVTAVPSQNTISYSAPSAPNNEAGTSLTGIEAKVVPTRRYIISRSLTGGIASITMAAAHGFLVGDRFNVSGLGSPFDGTDLVITSTPSSNTFTYSVAGANISPAPALRVQTRGRVGNTATIVTTTNHNIPNNSFVYISNMDSQATVLNGLYQVTVTNPTTFTYTVPANDSPRTITTRQRSVNLVTVTTSGNHGYTQGQTVRISGVNVADLNGTFTIQSITGLNTFTYQTSSSGDIASGSAGGSASVVTELSAAASNSAVIHYSYAEITRTIAEISPQPILPIGQVTVSGNLPFTSVDGTVIVESDILGTGIDQFVPSAGLAIKKFEIGFTPGLPTTTTVDFGPDLLEIDTQTRDVALNGDYTGARSKIDVLTDFFYLEPGENVIEFNDTKNPVSTALLKTYYKSGWLG